MYYPYKKLLHTTYTDGSADTTSSQLWLPGRLELPLSYKSRSATIHNPSMSAQLGLYDCTVLHTLVPVHTCSSTAPTINHAPLTILTKINWLPFCPHTMTLLYSIIINPSYGHNNERIPASSSHQSIAWNMIPRTHYFGQHHTVPPQEPTTPDKNLLHPP